MLKRLVKQKIKLIEETLFISFTQHLVQDIKL